MVRSAHAIHATPRSMRGMSLVEILVAALIGLIGMTVIMQVFSVSETRKRTTTGTSDAQITGNIAMFTLEQNLRLAGYGMVTASVNMLGCNTLAYDSTRPVPDFSFTMAPVIITTGAGGAPDKITIAYGNSNNVVEGGAFASAAASGADFPLKNAAGFLVGDLVVASESVLNCSLAEVTGFPAAAINTVQHVTGASYSYTNTQNAVVNATATHNKAGGSGVNYTSSAMLFSLGRFPLVITYSISNDKLKTETLIPYNSAQDPDADGDSDADIAAGVVQLKAEYGKDTNGDSIVDTWDATLPAGAQWLQVRAIRVGLLARSGQYEKTAVTPAAPSWYGGLFTMTNPADGTDWHNYRYRVYQTVVPLRNMIWSTDP